MLIFYLAFSCASLGILIFTVEGTADKFMDMKDVLMINLVSDAVLYILRLIVLSLKYFEPNLLRLLHVVYHILLVLNCILIILLLCQSDFDHEMDAIRFSYTLGLLGIRFLVYSTLIFFSILLSPLLLYRVLVNRRLRLAMIEHIRSVRNSDSFRSLLDEEAQHPQNEANDNQIVLQNEERERFLQNFLQYLENLHAQRFVEFERLKRTKFEEERQYLEGLE